MRDEAWELAARRSRLPMVLHFLLCPESPPSGALLNERGRPVLTDYSKVDWKSLSRAANAMIREKTYPNDIKIYVADDAIEIMDFLNISIETGLPFQGVSGFEPGFNSVLSRLEMADMRGGITRVRKKFPELHRNKPNGDDGFPPAAGIIMSIRFSRATQIIDYLPGVCAAVFGDHAADMMGDPHRFEMTSGDMPEYLSAWLREQFGVVYAPDCKLFLVRRTFSV